ncbi:hypothetical protein O0L34_g17985 [Tuta absoluta]|nr:hypothetical protein O0L34_g17985 [Tuta absoluta]
MALKRVLLPERLIPKLICEVKKRECIWNPEDDNYNDRHATMVAWKEIVKVMDNTPEVLVRAKWKNLRDLFKREIKKVRKRISENDQGETYQGRWKYFKQMRFMHQQKPDREFLNQLDVEELEDERSNDMDAANGEEHEDTDENEENPLADFVKPEPEDSNDTDHEGNDEEYFELVPTPVPNKRKMEATKEDEEDYDMMFLKSLTPFLNQLDPMRKLIVRSKIQDILINELAIAQQQASKNNQRH